MSYPKTSVLAVLAALTACDAAPAQPPPVTVLDDTGLAALLTNPGEAPLVVDFFATWCSACRGELPELQAFARQHPSLTFALVSVDEADTPVAVLQDYAVSGGVDLPLYHLATRNPVSSMERLVPGFGGGLPVALVVDPGGAVRGFQAGRIEQDALARLALEVPAP